MKEEEQSNYTWTETKPLLSLRDSIALDFYSREINLEWSQEEMKNRARWAVQAAEAIFNELPDFNLEASK